MICPNCGRETPDGMAFCFNCGAKLAAPSQAQQAAAEVQREAQAQAEQAAAEAQREAQAQAEQARLQAEEAARQQAAEAQREAQAQAQQAQQQAQQAQQQFNQQYGPQQYNPQYGPQGPQGPQQYGPQQYGPQQYQQYGPQGQQPRQQYQAPPQPKQPSKFDKLLTGEPPLVLDFYLRHYNTLLAVGSMITLAFIGVAFALLVGSTGWTLSLLFLAGFTFFAAVFAQIMLSSKKTLGWIMTFVAGGLRWCTVLVLMICLFTLVERMYNSAPLVLYNCFYSIVALMLHGALLAFAVIVFIKNKNKFK